MIRNTGATLSTSRRLIGRGHQRLMPHCDYDINPVMSWPPRSASASGCYSSVTFTRRLIHNRLIYNVAHLVAELCSHQIKSFAAVQTYCKAHLLFQCQQKLVPHPVVFLCAYQLSSSCQILTEIPPLQSNSFRQVGPLAGGCGFKSVKMYAT